MSEAKKKLTISISEDVAEQLREMSFFLRKPQSALVEEMITDAYRRWKEEQKKKAP